jgi:hypothetical protein
VQGAIRLRRLPALIHCHRHRIPSALSIKAISHRKAWLYKTCYAQQAETTTRSPHFTRLLAMSAAIERKTSGSIVDEKGTPSGEEHALAVADFDVSHCRSRFPRHHHCLTLCHAFRIPTASRMSPRLKTIRPIPRFAQLWPTLMTRKCRATRSVHGSSVLSGVSLAITVEVTSLRLMLASTVSRHHSGLEPVLLLPVPSRHHQRSRRTAAVVPGRSPVGEIHAARQDSRGFAQPRTLHGEGARM